MKNNTVDLNNDFEYMASNLWMELGDVRELDIPNRFKGGDWEKPNKIAQLIVNTCLEPDALHFFTKYVLNVDILPFQGVALRMLWEKKFPMFIATRGGSKSFTIALYIVMRAVLHQGCTIAVTGASLRQSMVLFNYVENIWNNAPILRDICGGKNGAPKKELHMCSWKCGKSKVIFLPLGDGSKIRGQRANVVVCDEFASVPPAIFETVVRGFASVKSDGVFSAVVEAAKQRYMKERGEAPSERPPQVKLRNVLDGNQIIIAGTADFQFNHFYKYYRIYKAIITSGGDKQFLKENFNDLPLDIDNIDPRDYAILRIPYDKIAPGMMDETILSQGRATMDPIIFNQEYGCCAIKGERIITKYGIKNIEDIVKGDLVLTHKGRFRPVSKCTYRLIDEEIIQTKVDGYDRPLSFTTEHPFWQDDENYLPITREIKTTYLANLRELNNKQNIKISDYIANYIEDGKNIYAKPSRMMRSNEELRDIQRSSDIGNLAVKYKTSYQNIWSIKNKLRVRKGKIPNELKLDYDLGLIFGYYAAEGSIGANGRAISFSLDGHINQTLQTYVDELTTAIQNVFHIIPKYYKKYNHVVDVTINNRLLVDFIKSICPGVSHTKQMNPDVLFSNEKFIEGFLKGYWHGDGCTSQSKFGVASSVSLNLITQVKLCMSYFQIGSSISEKPASIQKIENRLVNCRNFFALTVRGQNYNKLLRLLGKEVSMIASKQNIESTIPWTKHRITSIERVQYTGPVFNFEIEEDHTYSCLGATVHNCFPADSEGFFLGSYIHNATCPVLMGDGTEVKFPVKRLGALDRTYVMGIDPASEDDNFAIAILELCGGYRAYVYQWTTNRHDFEQMKRDKLIDDSIKDYHTFCIKHIRDLKRRFNISMMVMDTGGGGVHIREGLKDPDKMSPGDQPIIDMDDENNTDKGERILKMIEFSSSEWRRDAHYGMRKDILDKILLFPAYDTAEITIAARKEGAGYDTTEDTYYEILQAIQETIMIKHTATTNGTERWDVPNVVGLDDEDNKKKLKKDRFTSLLLANWGCRLLGVKGYSIDSSIYSAVKRGSIAFAPSAYKVPVNMKSSHGRKIFF